MKFLIPLFLLLFISCRSTSTKKDDIKFSPTSSFSERLEAAESYLFLRKPTEIQQQVKLGDLLKKTRERIELKEEELLRQQWFKLLHEKRVHDVYIIANENLKKLNTLYHPDRHKELIDKIRDWKHLLATAELQLSKYPEGKQKLEELIQEFPSWTPAYLTLAQYYLSQTMPNMVLSVSQKALEHGEYFKEDALVLYVKAVKAVKGSFLALKELQKYEPYFSDFKFTSRVYELQGNLLEDQGEENSACESYRKATDPQAVSKVLESAFLGHGKCLALSKRRDLFEVNLTNSQKVYPGSLSTQLLFIYDAAFKGQRDLVVERIGGLKETFGSQLTYAHFDFLDTLEKQHRNK